MEKRYLYSPMRFNYGWLEIAYRYRQYTFKFIQEKLSYLHALSTK